MHNRETPDMGMRVEVGSAKTARPKIGVSVWRLVVSDHLSIAAVCVAPPLFLFIMFGVHGGMPWDYSLVYISESHSGLEVFLYGGDQLRIFTNIFYNVGYDISDALGLDGSFVGYHIIYVTLWVMCGFLVYALCKLLSLENWIALSAAAIVVFSGSDSSIGHVGQIQQFGNAFWALLSFCLFLWFMDGRPWRTAALAGSTIFGAVGVWSYEGLLFGLLIGPSLLLFLKGKWRASWVGAIASAVPQVVYAYLMANRLVFHPHGTSYQEAVLRPDVGNVAHLIQDATYLVFHLFAAPLWLWGKMTAFNLTVVQAVTQIGTASLIGGLAIALAVALFIGRASREKVDREERRFLLNTATVFLILACSFVAPFLALNLKTNALWRTQVLATPCAAVSFAIGLKLIVEMFVETGQIRKYNLTVCFAVVLACGILANEISYSHWNESWNKVRDPIARLLQAVPDVVPGTVILLQGVPASTQSIGSTFWFDMLLRLAYPHKAVAGSYIYSRSTKDIPYLPGLTAEGGGDLRLANGRTVLTPHGHELEIVEDNVTLARAFFGLAVDGAKINQVIALEWTDSGPMKIIQDKSHIDMAVYPADGYDPYSRILPVISPVARRRFGLAARDTFCPGHSHLNAALQSLAKPCS